jgi:hypothetical protein
MSASKGGTYSVAQGLVLSTGPSEYVLTEDGDRIEFP